MADSVKKAQGKQLALAMLSKLRPLKVVGDDESEAIESYDAMVAAVQTIMDSRPDFSAIVEAIERVQVQIENPVDFSALSDSINALAEKLGVDLTPLAEAIQAQDLQVNIDLSNVESELRKINQSILAGNVVLLQLAKAATAEKLVSYDSQSRVSSIKIKT